MPLHFRPAVPGDFQSLKDLCIAAFEPITWFKRADLRFGPLNGKDWRARWETRFDHAFAEQHFLVGEADGEIVAFASGAMDPETRLGYIDLLGVDQRRQGKGYGRQMLRAMLQWMKEQGMVHAHLECLVTNEVGNNLYRAEGFEEVARSIRWFIKIP